jgi:hypothetical protein
MQLSDADREYLRTMYDENAEQARQHETLRAGITAALTALMAGLMAYAVEAIGEHTGKQWYAGVLICFISVLGGLVSHKHYERNRMHVAALRELRRTLEAGLNNANLADIVAHCRRSHFKKYRVTRHIRLNTLWLCIYLLTFAAGLVLTRVGDVPPELCAWKTVKSVEGARCLPDNDHRLAEGGPG